MRGRPLGSGVPGPDADPAGCAGGPRGRRSLTARALAGMLWTGGSTAARLLLQVAVLAVLARLLTPEDFGIVGAALVVVSFGNTLASMGVGPALVQHPEPGTAHRATGFTLSLVLGLSIGIGTYLISGSVERFFDAPEIQAVVKALSVTFPIVALGVVSESTLLREMRFRELAAVDVLAYGVGYGLIGIMGAFLGFRYWALVAAAIGQASIRTVLVLLRAPQRDGLSLDRRAASDLIYVGGGFSLARFANYFATQGDNLIVGRFLGPVALGLYGRAYQLLIIPAKVYTQVADRVVFPAMSQVQADADRLGIAYLRGVALGALLGIPISAASIILAPELILVLLGSQWTDLTAPFQVLAVGMFFRLAYKTGGTVLRAKGQVYTFAGLESAYALTVLVGAWIGQRYGLTGVCAAVVISTGVHFALVTIANAASADLRLRQVASAHVPGMAQGVIATLSILALAAVVRPVGAPLLTLGLCSLGSGLAFFLSARLLPSVCLGPHGVILSRHFTSMAQRQ